MVCVAYTVDFYYNFIQIDGDIKLKKIEESGNKIFQMSCAPCVRNLEVILDTILPYKICLLRCKLIG